MRWGVLVLGVAASGCWNFEQAFRDRCDAGAQGDDAGFHGDLAPCFPSATGGGNGGGGGGSGGGSAEVDAGPTDFSSAPWAWEHPFLRANDLFAVWGTSDSDVYFAGAGNTLLHFDGGQFEDQSARLPRFDGGLWDKDPVITAASSGAGGTWLIGENVGLLHVTDGNVFTPTPVPSLRGADFEAISAATDDPVLISRGDFLWARLSSTSSSTALAGVSEVRSVLADDAACVVTVGYDSPPRSALLGCDGGLIHEGALSDGGSNQFWNLFRLRDGGLAVGGNEGRVFSEQDASTLVARTVGSGSDVVRAASQTATTTLVCGDNGLIADAETGTNITRNADGLYAAWASPSGTFWAAGHGGAIIRLGDHMPRPLGPAGLGQVRAMWVDDAVQLAVGDTGTTASAAGNLVLQRDGGAWSKVDLSEEHNWVAVAVSGATTWLMSQQGVVYRNKRGNRQLVVVGTLPLAPDNLAAAAVTEDGGLLVASGGILARGGPDGGLDSLGADGGELLPLTPGGGLSQIIAVTARAGKITVASPGAVYQSADDGQTWDRRYNALQSPSSVVGLASCADGTVIVVGTHGLLVRALTDGSLQDVYAPGVPEHVNFSAAWCEPGGTVWTVSEEGFVNRFSPDGGVFRQSTGWGRRDVAQINPSFIGGNSTHLFITGDRGAILSRRIGSTP